MSHPQSNDEETKLIRYLVYSNDRLGLDILLIRSMNMIGNVPGLGNVPSLGNISKFLVDDLVVPYMAKSKIIVRLSSVQTYYNLLEIYNKELRSVIQSLNSSLLGQSIYLFEVHMEPEKQTWKLWKSKDEIMEFMQDIEHEINEMMQSTGRSVGTGEKILSLFKQLKGELKFDQQSMGLFVEFLNRLGDNIYIKKAQEYLLFLEHCVPIDKWDMKIYKQLEVYKAPTITNKISGYFSSNKQSRQRDYFLTISSDGILKSDNHLLESRIKQMIPFTNQLRISLKVTEKQSYLTYTIQSCAHEALFINFYKDYTKAINFGISIKMALLENSYSEAHRFKSYSPQRSNCSSKLYCDGAEYFADMYEELQNAKWQVCITDWMLSPYFLLKRPSKIDQKQHRLDGVLHSLAEKGVKIYIICFMEPSMFVNNDSEHAQVYLESLHDNIKVYRHPNSAIPILWSHHEKLCIIDQEVGFMGGLDICYGRWDYGDHLLTDPRGDLWDGADYNNYRTKDIYEPRKYKQSNLNPKFQPRMPWHDIALQYRGDVVLDLLRHFVQYWYYVKSQLVSDPIKGINFLKKRYDQAFNSTNETEKSELAFYMQEIKKMEKKGFMGKMKTMFLGKEEKYPELFIQKRHGCKVGTENLQMCRSASDWSIGIMQGQHESSIHNAYQTLIKESKSFIYIENQFFMGLENQVVNCLAERISRAFHEKQPFRVVVVMPLLPGFEGDMADPNSTVLRIQVHYQFQAIKRDTKKSLHAQLKFIPNLDDYIFFFGLRQKGKIDSTPVTQIIYVHSKLMIVDDERAIIGSANINDRSLLGNRDSELACVIEEKQGNIQNLRIRAFQEHFGLSADIVRDIMSDQFWNLTINNAKKATMFYRKVFGCIPDDTVTVGSEIANLAKTADISKFDQEKDQVVGHAVVFPLDFMKDENLNFRPGQKEYYAPVSGFT